MTNKHAVTRRKKMPQGFGPNCLLGICCPPGSQEAKNALAEEIVAGMTERVERHVVDAIAGWVIDNYDLAPHGTLQPFKDAIAAFARENP